MKKLFLVIPLILVLSCLASEANDKAASVNLIYDRDAVIKFCRPDLMGCARRIIIDDKSYLVDPVGQSLQEALQKLEESYAIDELYETVPGSVVGFMVKEKGHFPNPMAEFDVFKMLALDFPRAQKKDNLGLEKIPKKVMDTLKAKFPKAEIRKWTRENEGGIVIYDIEFEQGVRKFEADILEDGTIHNWEREIAAKDLPEAVRKTLEKKYPQSILMEIMEITEVKEGKDELEGYEIVLDTAGNKEVEVTIAPDGTILEDSGEKSDAALARRRTIGV
jgi:hypothetical protein